MAISLTERQFPGNALRGAIMRARGALSKYLVLGFATVIAAALGSTVAAHAQVDLNLQSRVNPNPIPVIVQPIISTESSSGEIYTLENGKCGAGSTPARVQAAAAVASLRALASPAARKELFGDTNLKDRTALTAYFSARPDEVTKQLRFYYHHFNETNKLLETNRRLKLIPPPGKIDFCNQPQPVTVKFSFPLNPTYESNVLKSNQDSPGTSAGFGGQVQVTGPGAEGRGFDLVAFSAGSASTRYSPFPSKSTDTFTVQGFYQFFIDAYGCRLDGSCIDITTKTSGDKIKNVYGMITVDTLAVGVQNQTVFVPTYRTETADLLTPQVVFNRQNINLSGNSSCTSLFLPDQYNFCHYANIALAVGQTFSDVTSLQNANLAAAATLGERFNHTDFVLSITGTATGKTFENVPGGRQDLLLQIGPTLTYTPSQYIQASLPVTYNQNYSSVSAAAWHGVVVQPTLTIIFPVPN
jgi:hypothetical protein